MSQIVLLRGLRNLGFSELAEWQILTIRIGSPGPCDAQINAPVGDVGRFGVGGFRFAKRRRRLRTCANVATWAEVCPSTGKLGLVPFVGRTTHPHASLATGSNVGALHVNGFANSRAICTSARTTRSPASRPASAPQPHRTTPGTVGSCLRNTPSRLAVRAVLLSGRARRGSTRRGPLASVPRPLDMPPGTAPRVRQRRDGCRDWRGRSAMAFLRKFAFVFLLCLLVDFRFDFCDAA
jgi:hypothetical protein